MTIGRKDVEAVITTGDVFPRHSHQEHKLRIAAILDDRCNARSDSITAMWKQKWLANLRQARFHRCNFSQLNTAGGRRTAGAINWPRFGTAPAHSSCRRPASRSSVPAPIRTAAPKKLRSC